MVLLPFTAGEARDGNREYHFFQQKSDATREKGQTGSSGSGSHRRFFEEPPMPAPRTTDRFISLTDWFREWTDEERSMPDHIPGIYIAPPATGWCGNLYRRPLNENHRTSGSSLPQPTPGFVLRIREKFRTILPQRASCR
jgi:hypothetical protein